MRAFFYLPVNEYYKILWLIKTHRGGGYSERTYYVVKCGEMKIRKLLVMLMCVVMVVALMPVMAVAAAGAVVFRKREN